MSMEKTYEGALKAAGATVVAFRAFGSYQGDWWALVDYEGLRGWVQGCYGSCPGCDAIEAEFECEPSCYLHRYSYPRPKNCAACAEREGTESERLAAFGKIYLSEMMTQEQAEAEASRDIEWDLDAKEMLAWIVGNREAGGEG